MKILITGSQGQLGQALQSALDAHTLVCADSNTLNITDPPAIERFIKAEQPNMIINAAAYTRVDDAETDSETAYQVNEMGPRNLAIASEKCGATLLHVSTDYVFDGSGDRPWLESDKPNPVSVYGKSKLAGEHAVQEANPRHFIVRTAWLYHSSGRNFLRTMHGLADRDEVRVVDDQRGSPTNADDLAEAIACLIETDEYGVYHLVNSGSASWCELTREFYRQLGIRTKVLAITSAEYPLPAPRPQNSVLATDHASPIRLPSWQEGVSRLVGDIRENW